MLDGRSFIIHFHTYVRTQKSPLSLALYFENGHVSHFKDPFTKVEANELKNYLVVLKIQN